MPRWRGGGERVAGHHVVAVLAFPFSPTTLARPARTRAPAVPGEFVVRLGEDWGGSLHDLADGLAEFELGAEAAVTTLLTWLEFVEVELKGFGDLLEQLHLLRGALVTAGIEAVGTVRDNGADW